MKLSGIIIPSITVFNTNETINYEKTIEHVLWLIEQGADAITPAGSSGEWPALSLGEAKELIETVHKAIGKSVPTYPATGRYSTADTIALTQFAEKIGADGVMVSLPYVMLPDRLAILEHLRALRKASSIPILLYNNPWMYGVELNSQDLSDLARQGVIQGVKVSQGDPFKVAELKYLAGNQVQAFYGHDYAALEALLAGADGWFSAILNVFPRAAKNVWSSVQGANLNDAREIWHQRFMPFVYHVTNERVFGSPHPLATYKATLNILGRKVGEPRKPIQPLNTEQYRKLELLLKHME
jgi:4-hydroxy-tetrahydrodipicolinate synthase